MRLNTPKPIFIETKLYKKETNIFEFKNIVNLKIKAPTIPNVEPIAEGDLRPPSRINSNDISITSSSNIIGKGTPSLAAKIE